MKTIAVILAAILVAVSAALLTLAAVGAVAEWSHVSEEVGVEGAVADALMRLAIGAGVSVSIGSPAIVIWLRRERLRPGGRGYVAGACLAIAAAVALVAVALFATTDDAQRALVFLYPPIVSPLCALGVAAALSPRRTASSG